MDLPGGGLACPFHRVRDMAPDQSLAIRTDSVRIEQLGAGELTWEITDSLGQPWTDFDPANNRLEDRFESISGPVFRPVSSIRHPGPVPTRGTAIDIDGDGDADFFTHEYKPRILRNDGSAGFTDISNQSPPLPSWPREFVPADFNGDGKTDVLVVTFGAPLMLLRGDGTGRFTDLTSIAGLGGVIGENEVAVGDLDGDGDPDLLIPGYGPERLFRNEGGRLVEVTDSGVVDSLQTESATLADLDGDGLLDVILVNWDGESRVYRNLGGWKFERVPGPFPPEYYRNALVFDYDRDGIPDILFTGSSDAPWLCRGVGGLRFEMVPPAVHGLPPAFDAVARDIDGDGFPDLLLESLDRFVLLKNQNGRFVDQTWRLADMEDHFESGALGASPQAQWIDVDGDGDVDLASQMVTFYDMTRGSFPSYTTWVEDTSATTGDTVLTAPNPRIVLEAPSPSPFVSIVHGPAGHGRGFRRRRAKGGGAFRRLVHCSTDRRFVDRARVRGPPSRLRHLLHPRDGGFRNHEPKDRIGRMTAVRADRSRHRTASGSRRLYLYRISFSARSSPGLRQRTK